MKSTQRTLGRILILLMGLLIPLQAVSAAAITLDGSFGDWSGQPCISDVSGDAPQADDLITFCFVTDQSAEITYFMLERVGGTNSPLDAILYFDINDNGNYNEDSDRRLVIKYNPTLNSAKVDVDLLTGTGGYITQLAKGENWGQSGGAGGGLVEFSATFANLGLTPGLASSVSMYAASGNSGGSDQMGAVQWTPADILGLPLIGILLVSASLLLAWLTPRWLKPSEPIPA
jgi:hypothetical protein